MKSGMVREVDCLGRIVLPKEMRDIMDIKPKDALEIYVDGENIVLRKHIPFCILCSSTEDLVTVNEKKICRACLNNLKEL